MMNLRGVLILFVVILSLVVSGNCEVTIRVRWGWKHWEYHNVKFSQDYFKQFYNKCLCDNRRTCTADYYVNWYDGYVNNVVPGAADNNEDSGSSINYYCYYNGPLKITCQKINGNVEGYRYHHWYEVHETECHYSCLVFIWYDSGERIDFSDSELNVQRCYGSDCDCPVPTTTPIIQTTTEKATTTTTSTTTTTTTRPKSTTATSVTTESIDSTTAAAVPNSANDSNDDPQFSVIIGVVFAAIFIVIVIAVISIIFWRRKRRHRKSKPNNGIQSSIALNELNSNVYSTPENSLTGTHNNVASVSNNYSEIDGNKPGVSSDNDHDKCAKAIYDYGTVMNSKNEDTGYEYAGPDDVHVTDSANKFGIENVDGSTYSTAGTINYSINSPSANHTKDIYSRLHEESRQTNNPYNTLPQPDEEVHNSPTNTGSLADQPKNVYSRLHEENRQIQNPYNTLLQPTEDAHVSQTANQPSRYSFAQPISDRVSNEKTDSSEETSKDVTSQNHTYYVLEGGVENGDTCTKKRNTYFELENQGNVSDSDTEEA